MVLSLVAASLAIAGFIIGGSCLYLVHCPCRVAAKLGRRLFVVALLVLGVLGALAALTRHEGLAPLGLLAGLMIVAMLWESPAAQVDARNLGRNSQG